MTRLNELMVKDLGAIDPEEKITTHPDNMSHELCAQIHFALQTIKTDVTGGWYQQEIKVLDNGKVDIERMAVYEPVNGKISSIIAIYKNGTFDAEFREW